MSNWGAQRQYGWNNPVTNQVVVVTNGNNTGIFIYAGNPTFGNLIGWWTATGGTDQFGNPYTAGLNVSQGSISGALITGSIGDATILNSDFQQGTMEETAITFDTGGGMLLVYASTIVTTTFNSGSGNWLAPALITSVKAENVAGGSGGASDEAPGGFPSAGGAGGEYACEPALAVTPGNNYPYAVGAGGLGSHPDSSQKPGKGGDTTFAGDSVTVTAHGGAAPTGTASVGNGGVGGHGSSNTIHFNGGTGGNITLTSGHPNYQGAGGGSSGGRAVSGNNGTSISNSNEFGTGGGGGTAPSGGGAGARGGSLPNSGSTAGIGQNGGAPGGGGGGGVLPMCLGQANYGGPGANGQVKISYVSSQTLIAAIAPSAGTDSSGNAFAQAFTGMIAALQPGMSPAVVESWHGSSALSNSWAGTINYKLLSTNETKLVAVDLIPGTDTDGLTVLASGIIPATYRPLTNKWFPVGTNQLRLNAGGFPEGPEFEYLSTGEIRCNGIAGAATRVDFCVSIPLDL